jgi:hypothetical protein
MCGESAIPRSADGKPDFSGIWQSLSGADYGLQPHLATKDAPPGAGVVEGNVIPYQPWALQHRATNFAARAPPPILATGASMSIHSIGNIGFSLASQVRFAEYRTIRSRPLLPKP